MSLAQAIAPTRPALRVVANANASGSPGQDRLGSLVAAMRTAGADVELERTATLDELAALWQEDDGRRLVLVGGDGSLHAVANLPGERRDVALIPAGRANNVARSLGIPLDWEGAARLAVEGSVQPIDLIDARTPGKHRFVVESVSVGFLAQARVRYHGRNSADLLAGARAGAATLSRFHPLGTYVAGPSGEELLELSQLFVANLPLYEFGLRVAPQADPGDAMLDLIGIAAPTRLAVLKMLFDLRHGQHLPQRGVHTWRAKRIDIATNGCSPIVADSMDLGWGPVELRAAPAALRLVRP